MKSPLSTEVDRFCIRFGVVGADSRPFAHGDIRLAGRSRTETVWIWRHQADLRITNRVRMLVPRNSRLANVRTNDALLTPVQPERSTSGLPISPVVRFSVHPATTGNAELFHIVQGS